MFQLFGPIDPPPGVGTWASSHPGGAIPGFIPFLSAIVKLLIIIAGIYALFNFIFAGYAFISASGEPQKIAAAWSKIWQSIIGLLIVAASLLITALISWLLFRNPGAILFPAVYGP